MGGAVNERIQRLEAALERIIGRDSHIDASIQSDGQDRRVVYGDLAQIARAALTPPAMPAPQADVWPFEERW